LGSNIGLSVIYFKCAYPQCHIIAFEADPSTFEILSKNIQSYDLSSVVAHNLAVIGSAGFADFYIDRQSVGSPLMSTSPLRIRNSRKIKVSSIKLSSYINSSIDLVKMDIEGAEYLVLNDLSRTKRIKFIKEFCIEYHHHIDTKVDNFSKFLKFLEINNFGYQIHAAQSHL
jgi:FkbM family methyltransferase